MAQEFFDMLLRSVNKRGNAMTEAERDRLTKVDEDNVLDEDWASTDFLPTFTTNEITVGR